MVFVEEFTDGVSGGTSRWNFWKKSKEKYMKEFPEAVANNLQMEFLEESSEGLLKEMIR